MAGLVVLGAVLAMLACLLVGYRGLVEGINPAAARGILLIGIGLTLLLWLLAHTSLD